MDVKNLYVESLSSTVQSPKQNNNYRISSTLRGKPGITILGNKLLSKVLIQIVTLRFINSIMLIEI